MPLYILQSSHICVCVSEICFLVKPKVVNLKDSFTCLHWDIHILIFFRRALFQKLYIASSSLSWLLVFVNHEARCITRRALSAARKKWYAPKILGIHADSFVQIHVMYSGFFLVPCGFHWFYLNWVILVSQRMRLNMWHICCIGLPDLCGW